MIQRRLHEGGAEGRMRKTQFGFRPGRNASQAISIVRRMVEAACASSPAGFVGIFLDWATRCADCVAAAIRNPRQDGSVHSRDIQPAVLLAKKTRRGLRRFGARKQ
eukprot:5766283-Pyramimonas_sp.AAC.1